MINALFLQETQDCTMRIWHMMTTTYAVFPRETQDCAIWIWHMMTTIYAVFPRETQHLASLLCRGCGEWSAFLLWMIDGGSHVETQNLASHEKAMAIYA